MGIFWLLPESGFFDGPRGHSRDLSKFAEKVGGIPFKNGLVSCAYMCFVEALIKIVTGENRLAKFCDAIPELPTVTFWPYFDTVTLKMYGNMVC